MGVPVKALHHDANEPCLDTRFAQAITLPDFENNQHEWLRWLLDEGRRNAPVRGVLIPASDAMLLFVDRHREALEPFFRFSSQSPGRAEDWIGKPFQYAAAASAGVPFPATFAAATERDLESAVRHVALPCLVKPVLSHHWVRTYGRKLMFVRTLDELRSCVRDARERGLDCVIQEFIPASDDEIYGLFLCVNHASDPMGYCVARKLRQHEPRFGNSCMSQCVNEPRVVELGLRLVKAMGYHGIGSVEFKRDPRDGEFKLMEFNLRPTTMMGLAEDSGVNLPWLLYQHLCADGIQMNPTASAAVHAPITPRCFGKRVGILMQDLCVAKYLKSVGEPQWRRWARSWLGARDLYFAWDDLGPVSGYLHTFLARWRAGYLHRFPPSFLSREQWIASRWDGSRVPAENKDGPANAINSS